LCDENNHSSTCVCLLPIENERDFLKNKILEIESPNEWRRHVLKSYNSMIDEKINRADSGLIGSGSRYLCTLCEATREEAKTQLGSFNTTCHVANYLKVNPDNLSKTKLDMI
jgi:V(D)J recombination-activating protein 1